jgi:hypothetical protein
MLADDFAFGLPLFDLIMLILIDLYCEGKQI